LENNDGAIRSARTIPIETSQSERFPGNFQYRTHSQSERFSGNFQYRIHSQQNASLETFIPEFIANQNASLETFNTEFIANQNASLENPIKILQSKHINQSTSLGETTSIKILSNLEPSTEFYNSENYKNSRIVLEKPNPNSQEYFNQIIRSITTRGTNKPTTNGSQKDTRYNVISIVGDISMQPLLIISNPPEEDTTR